MTDQEIKVIKRIKDNIEKESFKISFNTTSESRIHYDEYARRVIELIRGDDDNITYDVDMENHMIHFNYNQGVNKRYEEVNDSTDALRYTIDRM